MKKEKENKVILVPLIMNEVPLNLYTIYGAGQDEKTKN